MKVSIQQTIAFLLTSILALTANAHPGHDHSAWSASAIHAVLYFSVAVASVLLGYAIYKTIAKKSEKQDK